MPPRPKIVVVDDSPVVLHWVESVLDEVATVVTHGEAMGSGALVVRERPDLVLLDVQMPLLTGEEVLESIRRSELARTTKVVLFSSLPAETLAAMAARCGAHGYLRKTGDGVELVRKVQELLTRPAPRSRPASSIRDADEERRVLIVGDDCLLPEERVVFERGSVSAVVIERERAALLEGLRRERPSLVTVGPELADAGLAATCREVRANDELKRVSIVGVLAAGVEPDPYVQAGVNTCLVRPFDVAELEQAVGKLIAVAVRRDVRVLVRLEVLHAREEHVRVGFSQNLSASGMLLEAHDDVPVGSALKLRFFVPGGKREVITAAEVVREHARLRDRRVVGLRFASIQESHRTAISRFVDKESRRHAPA